MKNMSKAAEVLIRKHTASFPDWSQCVNRFREIQMYESMIIPEDEFQICNDLYLICLEIMESLIEASNIKENWNHLHSLPSGSSGGLEIIYQSVAVKNNYTFGFDDVGFFLDTELSNMEGFRKMDDTFWFKLAELSQLGKLEYSMDRIPEPGDIRESPYLHRKSKSTLFTLIQDAIATEKLYGSPDYMGILIVRWKYNTSWEKLLCNAVHALQTLYYLNKTLEAKRKR